MRQQIELLVVESSIKSTRVLGSPVWSLATVRTNCFRLAIINSMLSLILYLTSISFPSADSSTFDDLRIAKRATVRGFFFSLISV
jgi:hypothetical protein